MNQSSIMFAFAAAVSLLVPHTALADDATTTNVGNAVEHGSVSATADAATASTHPSPLLEENFEAATPGHDASDLQTVGSEGLADEARRDSVPSNERPELGQTAEPRAASAHRD